MPLHNKKFFWICEDFKFRTFCVFNNYNRQFKKLFYFLSFEKIFFFVLKAASQFLVDGKNHHWGFFLCVLFSPFNIQFFGGEKGKNKKGEKTKKQKGGS